MVLEKQEVVKENERLKDELVSLTRFCEKMKKDSDAYENTLAELREQVSFEWIRKLIKWFQFILQRFLENSM